jgi:N-acetylglucosaminyl-diphospho-decaprenol L-rhamnosyltransferase
MRLCIVIVNYRTPGLVLDAIDSLEGQVEAGLDELVVVDNASEDGSAEQLERAIAARGLLRLCRVLRAEENHGFAAGCNIGIRAVHANYYLLLNSDTLVRKGAVAKLLAHMQHRPYVGIAGPRLDWPDGSPQASCFRDYTLVGEFLAAAQARPLNRALSDFQTALPVSDEPHEAQWVSFACVLIRREVFEKVGLLDEGYFLGFEDSDFCRAARATGFRVWHFPDARVVHLDGGVTVQARRAGRRAPHYHYAARTRYFHKGYGALGIVLANTAWSMGRGVALARKLTGAKRPELYKRQWLDNWTDAFRLQL